MPEKPPVPEAVTLPCPQCGEEEVHRVLKGRMGARGDAYVLTATVECAECGRVRQARVEEARDVEVPVIVSRGGESTRTRIELPGDEEVRVGDLLIVDDRNVKVTGLEEKEVGRRVEKARVSDVLTLWAMDFEEVTLRFSINLGKKTITKELLVPPETEVTVGQSYTFDRLEVLVHSIKTERKLVKTGTAEAGEIVRVFAKPAPRPKPYRPPKEVRERRRRAWEEAEEAPRAPKKPARGGGGPGRGRR